MVATLLGVWAAAALTGCEDDRDPRFKADTYDEYTEPLTNAVIGTPGGTMIISNAGVASDGGITIIDAGGGMPPTDAGRPMDAGSADGRPAGQGGLVGSTGGSFGGVGGAGGRALPDAGSGVGGRGLPDAGGGVGGAGGTNGSGRGFWHFDDCSATSNFLIDSSGLGANAQQALGAACVPGISGLGVDIRSAKDIIQVPDEPQFTVSQRVAVAAWVHPNTVTGDQPIVIKRLNNQTSFSLGVHNGNIEMSVVLTTGKTFISRAPITPGVWTHVAGMYDGTFVFLFINGQQFGQVFAGGPLRNVFAPIRIGATTQTQRFDGIIDEVFLSTENISKDVLIALSCISHASTFAVSPATGPSTPFGTPVQYDVRVTDNDIGACQPRQYDMFLEFFDPTISTFFDGPSGNFATASPGQVVDFGVSVTASEDAEPGSHTIPFEIESFSTNFSNFEFLTGLLDFEVTVPACFVSKRAELMITSTSVVDDPVRTSPQATGASAGVWTLGHLLRELAPTPEAAPALALQLFQTWLTDQTVNGFTVQARPAAQQQILDIWPKTATGDLDLDQAPFTLQAIVNRLDLRDLTKGSAGQGRFVFALNSQFGPFGFPQSFTVILEYNLPATTDQDVTDWANLWHGLSSHPFPSEEYNLALEAITRRITSRNAVPTAVNGSGLLQLRTNEIALSFQWELREFNLLPGTGFLAETTVKETPDLSFNNSATLATFVNQNEAAILAAVSGADSNSIPLQLAGANFRAGSVFNNLIPWSAPGINNPDARFKLSVDTCNGCHGPETGTTFLMITPRFPGSEAQLSPFLTGTTSFDPQTGQIHVLNDLARRQTDLTAIVCPPTPTPTPGSPLALVHP